MSRAFETEQEMVKAFLNSTRFTEFEMRYSEWKIWEALEINGLFGIPDIVTVFGKISPAGQKYIRAYAFELKLRNWRRALTQAFRYSAFAHYSCVVLDSTHIQPALANIHLFQRSNIGLLSISTNRTVTWHNYPKYQKPYSADHFQEFYYGLKAELFDNQQQSWFKSRYAPITP